MLAKHIELCTRLRNIIKDTDFNHRPDTVDGKPEYQIDVYNDNLFDRNIKGEYYPLIREIIFNKFGFDPTPYKPWAFIRKYDTRVRSFLDVHFDNTVCSLVIGLSNPQEYQGGEFIHVPRKYNTIQVTNKHLLLNCPRELRTKKSLELASQGEARSKKLNFGEIIFLQGRNYKSDVNSDLHGVAPVQSGVRYVLVIFFYTMNPLLM